MQKRLGGTRNGNPVIVTTTYRYKRLPRKRKPAAAYEEPVIVRAKAGFPAPAELLRSAAA